MAGAFKQVGEKIWQAYEAPTKRGFAQRLRRLKEWAETALPESAMKQHTLELCAKHAQFFVSYDHEQSHRTSNMVDQLMRFINRACFNAQYFPRQFLRYQLSVVYGPWRCCGVSVRHRQVR